MRLVDAAESSFARHETFHPRYGWFRKAYAFAARDSQAFTRNDAPLTIGVGKNMVRAIRFWGLAAKLIVESPISSSGRVPGLVPTRIGHALFGASGWDPFMEDPGTLWLLHWLLLAPRCRLPVWWLAFNDVHAIEFSVADLEMAILSRLEAVSEWTTPHPSSVRKDISALLRTYAPAERFGRSGIDDMLDCPLRELRLIAGTSAPDRHRFALGPKATLPSAIATYAALDYVARVGSTGNTITIGRLVNDAGGPGRVFKLSESDLLASLEPTVAHVGSLRLAAPAGAAQLGWTGRPEQVAVEVLDGYYHSTSMGFSAGPDGDKAIENGLRSTEDGASQQDNNGHDLLVVTDCQLELARDEAG